MNKVQCGSFPRKLNYLVLLFVHLHEYSFARIINFWRAKLMADSKREWYQIDRHIKLESWESFLRYLVTVKGTVHFVQCCKVFKTRKPRYAYRHHPWKSAKGKLVSAPVLVEQLNVTKSNLCFLHPFCDLQSCTMLNTSFPSDSIRLSHRKRFN